MHDEIQIHVQTAGMRDSDEARQRSLRSVTRLQTALLVLAPEIARVEQAIAVTSDTRATLSLAGRRKLDRGEARTAQ